MGVDHDEQLAIRVVAAEDTSFARQFNSLRLLCAGRAPLSAGDEQNGPQARPLHLVTHTAPTERCPSADARIASKAETPRSRDAGGTQRRSASSEQRATVSRSDPLQFRDDRTALRMVGECRDLGNAAGLWHRRMLEGLVLLFGMVQAAGGEAWWDRPGRGRGARFGISRERGARRGRHQRRRAEPDARGAGFLGRVRSACSTFCTPSWVV